ncbi:hypothetical protein J4423_00405 [Candidatus Pacearchaeota archaeon]|nr:hypothetical protein [Candidatus Pacearchaeota archaeon]
MSFINIITGSLLVLIIIGTFASLNTTTSPTSFLEKSLEFSKKIFGLEDLGNFSDNFFSHFILALFAGIILWLTSFLIKGYYSYIKGKEEGEKKIKGIFDSGIEIEYMKIRWINTIAGTPVKVFVMAIGYATLTQIPILGNIIQIITLSAIIDNYLYKLIILAVEIGYLPAILNWYSIKRQENKYIKEIKNVRRLKAYMNKT